MISSMKLLKRDCFSDKNVLFDIFARLSDYDLLLRIKHDEGKQKYDYCG